MCQIQTKSLQPNEQIDQWKTNAVTINYKLIRFSFLVFCYRAKKPEELSLRARRKGYTPRPTKQDSSIWYIDYHHLIQIIKYKHSDILTSLNKRREQGDVEYICPTVGCEEYNKRKSLMDLLMSGEAKDNDGFRCPSCWTTINDKQIHTLLIEVSTAKNSNANTILISDSSEELKLKFNQQLNRLIRQVQIVDEILHQEEQQYQANEEERKKNPNAANDQFLPTVHPLIQPVKHDTTEDVEKMISVEIEKEEDRKMKK